MGKPAWGHAQAPRPEYIGAGSTTRGTETSKYPEEEKSTEIPPVAASERGRAQTPACAQLMGVAAGGVVGPAFAGAITPAGSHKPPGKRNGMERPAIAGESPVRESQAAASPVPE